MRFELGHFYEIAWAFDGALLVLGSASHPGRLGRPLRYGVAVRKKPTTTILSPQERAVADLLIEGLTNDQIATQLGLSSHTVKFHLQNVCDKLGAGNRVVAAVRHARNIDAQAKHGA